MIFLLLSSCTKLRDEVVKRLGIACLTEYGFELEPVLTDLFLNSLKLLTVLISLNISWIVVLLFNDFGMANIYIIAGLPEHILEFFPVFIGKKVSIDIAVEEVLAREHVFSEERALTLRNLIIRNQLSIG